MFPRHFLETSTTIIGQISLEDLDAVVLEVLDVRDRGGRLFFCGSGGGAGHASHACCDFRKLAGVESYCVTDNVSELTARINDDGWDTAYSEWLRRARLSDRDGLFVFSVGGGDRNRRISTNLVTAVELAREVGASIVGIVGRDGGYVRSAATASVLIPVVDAALVTPQTEGLQALIWHLVVSDPRLAVMPGKWESMGVG